MINWVPESDLRLMLISDCDTSRDMTSMQLIAEMKWPGKLFAKPFGDGMSIPKEGIPEVCLNDGKRK